jgi:hypothetical protein
MSKRYKITEKRFWRIKNDLVTPIEVLPTRIQIARKYSVCRSTISKISDSPSYEYYKDYETNKLFERAKMKVHEEKKNDN